MLLCAFKWERRKFCLLCSWEIEWKWPNEKLTSWWRSRRDEKLDKSIDWGNERMRETWEEFEGKVSWKRFDFETFHSKFCLENLFGLRSLRLRLMRGIESKSRENSEKSKEIIKNWKNLREIEKKFREIERNWKKVDRKSKEIEKM